MLLSRVRNGATLATRDSGSLMYMIFELPSMAPDSRMLSSRNLIAYSTRFSGEPIGTPPPPVYVVFAWPLALELG